MLFVFRLFLALALALALVACASHGSTASKKEGKSDKPKSAFAMTYEGDSAVADRSYKMGKKMSMSAYNKKVYSAAKAFSGAKETYKTKEVASKAFHSGKDDFKTANFAQSDKLSHDAKLDFSGSSSKSHFADKLFATKDSTFTDRKSRDDDKNYSDSNKSFHYANDVQGTKAFEHSKAPKMTKDKSTTYTEDQVQKLLNKS